jgi:hypothetical protein
MCALRTEVQAMSKVSNDYVLQRSIFLLENRAHDPSYLLSMWKLTGPVKSSQVPEPEKLEPWWEGLFEE